MQAERERAREAPKGGVEKFRSDSPMSFRRTEVGACAPVDDERPGAYRERLFEFPAEQIAVDPRPRYDPVGMKLAPAPARRRFKQMLLEAAKAEGSGPQFLENLPRDGSMITRVRADPDSGQRRTEFFGRRSFIHDFSMQPENGSTVGSTQSPKKSFGGLNSACSASVVSEDYRRHHAVQVVVIPVLGADGDWQSKRSGRNPSRLMIGKIACRRGSQRDIRPAAWGARPKPCANFSTAGRKRDADLLTPTCNAVGSRPAFGRLEREREGHDASSRRERLPVRSSRR